MVESPLLQEFFDERLRAILERKDVAIESPLIEEFVAERVRATAQENILAVLEARFGQVPRDLAESIRAVADDARLRQLVRKAASCADLEALRKEIGD